MTENIYEHIDLCEIYEPIFEPPESFLKECCDSEKKML